MISIIIPAFNEEKTIREVIESVRPYCDEILVICAKQTTDRTREIAESLNVKVFIDEGKGKGNAIRIGIKNARGDILVFMDADGSHQPKDIPELITSIKNGKSDMIIASRLLGGSEEFSGTFYNFLRLWLSLMLTQLINWRFGSSLTDPQNGFRAIKKDVAENLNLKANGFNIETEMVIKCLKKGYRIREIPSRELKRKHGRSRISLIKHGPSYLWVLLINLF